MAKPNSDETIRWKDWSDLLINRVERLNESNEQIADNVREIRSDLAVFKRDIERINEEFNKIDISHALMTDNAQKASSSITTLEGEIKRTDGELVRLNRTCEQIATNIDATRTDIAVLKQEVKQTGDFHKRLDQMAKDITELKTELKLKGGVWGLLGGAIPTTLMLVLWLLKK